MTAQTRTVVEPSGAPAPGRLAFLDALRGTAVLLVLLQHVGERLSPAFRDLTTSTVNLGQLGVLLFFLCSGFIVPASLERGAPTGVRAALRRFWIGRFCRLYPLYWLSLAGAGLLVAAGRHPGGEELGALDWLANVSMLQAVAGRPHGLELYWTLTFELAFYLGVSVLFALRLHRFSVGLSLAASGLCLLTASLAPALLDRPAPLAPFCLATMLLGTVFARWHEGAVPASRVALCTASALAGGGALLFSVTLTGVAPGAPAPVAFVTSWCAAYAVFVVGAASRHRRPAAWLRRLGTLSYSVYLVHALVLLAVPATPWPALTALTWVAVTLALSVGTHLVVERPAIAFGRRWVARRPAGRTAPRRATLPVSRPLAHGTGTGSPGPRPRRAAISGLSGA